MNLLTKLKWTYFDKIWFAFEKRVIVVMVGSKLT